MGFLASSQEYNQMVVFDSHVALQEKSKVSHESGFACHWIWGLQGLCDKE